MTEYRTVRLRIYPGEEDHLYRVGETADPHWRLRDRGEQQNNSDRPPLTVSDIIQLRTDGIITTAEARNLLDLPAAATDTAETTAEPSFLVTNDLVGKTIRVAVKADGTHSWRITP